MTSPDVPPSPAASPASQPGPAAAAGVQLGLRANLAQFSLLVAVNALVGGTLGQERTVVPLLAEQTFHLAALSGALTFILAFGAVKAVTNFFAGTLSDRFGRKPVLVAGWLAALPIPPLLIWAPDWGWVIAANVLLGVNQGLTWSTTVIMKIDLVGPARRGLAMGLNEAAGYGAVAITALATGYLAAANGLRPAPFLLGAAYIALGLGLSAAAVPRLPRRAPNGRATDRGSRSPRRGDSGLPGKAGSAGSAPSWSPMRQSRQGPRERPGGRVPAGKRGFRPLPSGPAQPAWGRRFPRTAPPPGSRRAGRSAQARPAPAAAPARKAGHP